MQEADAGIDIYLLSPGDVLISLPCGSGFIAIVISAAEGYKCNGHLSVTFNW